MLNILGTNYNLYITDEPIINESIDCDGLCSTYSKKIQVRSVDKMLDLTDSTEAKRKRFNEVLRHEIIHAFLFESGLVELCSDEQLVNLLAMQFPKLLELFNEHSCTK